MTAYTFLPSSTNLTIFSENESPPRIRLQKLQVFDFDDSCQSQINTDEVERKRAKEIVAIFQTDLTEDDSRMRMFVDNQLDFLQFRKFSFQPIRIKQVASMATISSLSHRREIQTAEATATVAMTTIHFFPIAEIDRATAPAVC